MQQARYYPALHQSSEREVTILAIADAQVRIEALRAGAAAVLDPAADEQILLARIRGLLRDAEDVAEQVGAMREAAAPFRHAREDRARDRGVLARLTTGKST